jgi:hypothetical protein
MPDSPTLPPALLPLLRRLWSDPRLLVILLTLARAPGPLTASQIVQGLAASKEAVAHKLTTLSAMGLVTCLGPRRGWYLTRSGWVFILNPQTSPFPDPVPVDMAENPPFAAPPMPAMAENPPFELSPAETKPDSCQKTASNGGFYLQEESIIDQLEESLIDQNLNQNLSDQIKAAGENLPPMSELLARSELLFGDRGVMLHHLPERPPRLVLAWLAQAYDQRQRLRVPAGLVYKRLLHGAQPARPYLDHPLDFLPAAYLAAIGLSAPPVDRDDFEDASPPSSLRAHGVRPESPSAGNLGDNPPPPAPDPTLYTILNNRTIFAAWEQATYLLSLDLPSETCRLYLEPARPLRWIPPDTLAILVPTPYQRDWLESRLQRTLERLLTGILAQGVRVEVVCP